MRDQLDDAIKAALMTHTLDSSLEEYEIDVPMSDGWKHKATVVRRKTCSQSESTPTTNSNRPLIVLFHGGGFCAGSANLLIRPARDFAKAFDAVVVSCTYRLSPEHKFPLHFDDAMDTVKWLANHTQDSEIGAHTEAGFIIGGQSAGASLAATVLQHMQESEMGLRATGGYICIPLLLTDAILPPQYKDIWTSRDENCNKLPLLSAEGVAKMVAAMGAEVQSPKFSPFSAARPHRDLPRIYVQVGKLDPLRDDGLVYERALRDSGVETRLECYDDIGHDTWSIFSNEQSPKDFAKNSLAAMEWLLKRDE